MNLNKNKRLIRYSTNWLWAPTILILISLIAPILTTLVVYGYSDPLRFQIFCYVFLNIFLVSFIWLYKQKDVHKIVGIILLALAFSFILGFFEITAFYFWFTHNALRFLGLIIIPLVISSFLLIFLPDAYFSKEQFQLYPIVKSFKDSIFSPESKIYEFNQTIKFQQGKATNININSDNNLSLFIKNQEKSYYYEIQSEKPYLVERIFFQSSNISEPETLIVFGKAVLGNNGMLYSFKTISNYLEVNCSDKKFNAKWTHRISYKDYCSIDYLSCFFDSRTSSFEFDPNIYLLLKKNVFENKITNNTTKHVYCFYVISPDGKLLWTKDINISFLLPQFTQPGITIKDRFIVAGSNLNRATTLICSSINGDILWQTELTQEGTHVTPCAIDRDSNLVISLNAEKSFLQSWDKEGKKVWEKPIDGTISTPPLIDSDNNIYVGVFNSKRSVHSFTQNGELRWKTVEPDPESDFYTPLIFGSNQTIYYLASGQNKLYCIQNLKN